MGPERTSEESVPQAWDADKVRGALERLQRLDKRRKCGSCSRRLADHSTACEFCGSDHVRWQVWGAEEHRYLLVDPLPEEDIAAFESLHQCKLPREYRDFIADVGSGGAGPGSGLFRFGDFDVFPVCDLSKPFPFEEEGELNDPDSPLNGCFPIAEHGCAGVSHLVVTGQVRGEIWDTHEGMCYAPVVSDSGRRCDFRTWYMAWLDGTEEWLQTVQQ